MSLDPKILKPGMLLLYEASSLFGYAIAAFSGSRISHIEMYAGDGTSYASRDGVGVDEYPLRLKDLALVLEAVEPLNMDRVREGFSRKIGHRYDNSTILKFATFGLFGGKPMAEVCSEIQAYLVRVGGLERAFGDKQPDEVKPSDFVDAMNHGVFRKVWSNR